MLSIEKSDASIETVRLSRVAWFSESFDGICALLKQPLSV